MPGYEKSQFVSLSQTEEDELSCGICFGIFINPMVTPCCRQTYCNECINEWLNQNNTCPNDRSSLKSEGLLQPPRLVINLLNKLNMRCSFLENGCNQTVFLEKLRQHMDCCKHNPLGICRECGTKNGDRGLHNCIENLLSKITSIENLKREAIQRYELLEKYVQQNRKESIEINNEIKDLRKQNFHINGEIQKFKQSNNDLKTENSRVKNNRAICEATIDKLRKVNSDLVNKNREINEKLEKIIEYNNTFENMMRIKNELIEEINKLEANKESLNCENEINSKFNQRLKTEISGLSKEKVEFMQEIKSLNQKSIELKNENLRIIKYCGENDKLLKSNNFLKTEIFRLENDKKHSVKIYNEMHSKYHLKASETEELLETTKELKMRNKQLLNTVKFNAIEYNQTIELLKEGRIQLKNVEDSNNILFKQIEEELKENQFLQIKNKELQNNNIHLENQNFSAVNETKNLKKQINDWVSDYNRLDCNFQTTITEKKRIEEKLECRNWLLCALIFLILSLVFILFFNPIFQKEV